MKRIAIVIGVNGYHSPVTPLKCAEQDAAEMFALFRRSPGYSDVSLLSGTGVGRSDDVLRVIKAKLDTVGPGDLAVLYFAGHGTMKACGEQLLLFPDADVDELDYYRGAIALEQLKRVVRKRKCNCLMILDACRRSLCDNTRAAVPDGSAGLRDLTVSTKEEDGFSDVPDLAIYYGCQEGRCSVEGKAHGLFTEALMAVMGKAIDAHREVRFGEAFRDDVFAKMQSLGNGKVGNDQKPTPYGDLSVPLVEGQVAVAPTPPPRPEPPPAHRPAAQAGPAEMFRLFAQAKCERDWIAHLPDGAKRKFAAEIRAFEIDFAAAEDAKACSEKAAAATLVAQALEKIAVLKAKVERERDVEPESRAKVVHDPHPEPKPGEEMTISLPGGEQMTFCWCPATTSEEWKRISGGQDFFWMGSAESENGRGSDETRHCVKLTQGCWMGKYPVTQRQWASVMGSNPSKFAGGDQPVERVSWDRCQEFIRKVNAAGTAAVALPTEAQWEHACRAGTTTPFSFGSALNGDRANCDGNYPYGTATQGPCRPETSPVGSYAPNAWGLYDMHGNVLEWCEDLYDKDFYTREEAKVDPRCASGSSRVMRGGSWYDGARNCRSAYRSSYYPSYNYNYFGFRLCCSAGLQK